MPDRTRSAAADTTYIAAPLRFPVKVTDNVRSTVTRVEQAITRAPAPEPGATPSMSDRLNFWNVLSEWCNQNIAAIEGQVLARSGTAGNASSGAGAPG